MLNLKVNPTLSKQILIFGILNIQPGVLYEKSNYSIWIFRETDYQVVLMNATKSPTNQTGARIEETQVTHKSFLPVL